jgi:hypothetical protein
MKNVCSQLYRLFFEKAFKHIGGDFTEIRKSIFRIDILPDVLAQTLSMITTSSQIPSGKFNFCFDKQVFLEYLNIGDLGKVHYINPSNPVFDSLVKVIRSLYREDMLKGTVLISPIDKEDYFAFFVKSQITDNRPHKDTDSIADERLMMVQKSRNTIFKLHHLQSLLICIHQQCSQSQLNHQTLLIKMLL